MEKQSPIFYLFALMLLSGCGQDQLNKPVTQTPLSIAGTPVYEQHYRLTDTQTARS